LITETLCLAITVGFIAQMIDGALGMAYGVTSTSFLLSLGIPAASASASVHTSEVFTTLASGLAHLKLKNVDKSLFKTLLIPGMIGGALGAYILTSVPTEIIKPLIGTYLLIMGLLILRRLFYRKEPKLKTNVTLLGGVGGFLDAVGGGGWGPVVTSTLMTRGDKPQLTIGSVNLAEFFVTLTEAATFFTILGITHWEIILGLIIGGVISAPFAAYTCKKLPSRILMAIVGTVIIALSIRNLYLTLI
jgi:uncharacterized membrane protein YfcA